MFEDWPTLPSAREPLSPPPEPPDRTLAHYRRDSVPLARQGLTSRPLTTTHPRGRLGPDAVQSALSELNVLNEQLIALPDRLVERGVAREQRLNLRDALRAHAALNARAWEALAADQLDLVAETAAYRQLVVATSRRVSRLQQVAAMPRAPEDTAPLPKPGYLWSVETNRYIQALVEWRDGLRAGTSPDTFRLGQASEDLQSALGLGTLSPLSVTSHRVFLVGGLTIVGGITATYIAAATSAITLKVSVAPPLVAVAVAGLAWFIALLWLLVMSHRDLWHILGTARGRLLAHDAARGLVALGVWRWFAALSILGGGGVLVFLLGRGGAGAALRGVHDLTSGLTALAGPILPAAVAILGLLLAAPVAMYLPATLLQQIGSAHDLRRNPSIAPAARRTYLPLALRLAAWHGSILLTVAALILLAYPHVMLVALGRAHLTLVSPLALVILIGGYLIGVEWPYRVGVDRWRQSRLRDLAEQRQSLTARLDRLDPEPQDTLEIGTAQYDVARLQYVQLQEEAVRRVRAAPYRARAALLALLIVVIAALGIDLALDWLPTFFVLS